MAIECPECGQKNDDTASKCDCGFGFTTPSLKGEPDVFCGNCGVLLQKRQIKDGNCWHCGKAIVLNKIDEFFANFDVYEGEIQTKRKEESEKSTQKQNDDALENQKSKKDNLDVGYCASCGEQIESEMHQFCPYCGFSIALTREDEMPSHNQSISQNELSDVITGGKWAKWFGIAKMALGLILLWMLNSSNPNTIQNLIQYADLDAVINIGIGAISLYLGLQLLNSKTRKISHFTVLIIIYGISVTLHFLNYLIESSATGSPSGMIVPILSAYALWKFFKGRRELKKVENAGITP